MKDETKAIALISIGGTVFVGAVAKYVHFVRSEKKKRQQIEVWERTNIECIRNSRDRLIAALCDDSVTADQFMRLLAEESAFLKIVYNQPM
jgi:hypothetical protein